MRETLRRSESRQECTLGYSYLQQQPNNQSSKTNSTNSQIKKKKEKRNSDHLRRLSNIPFSLFHRTHPPTLTSSQHSQTPTPSTLHHPDPPKVKQQPPTVATQLNSPIPTKSPPPYRPPASETLSIKRTKKGERMTETTPPNKNSSESNQVQKYLQEGVW